MAPTYIKSSLRNHRRRPLKSATLPGAGFTSSAQAPTPLPARTIFLSVLCVLGVAICFSAAGVVPYSVPLSGSTSGASTVLEGGSAAAGAAAAAAAAAPLLPGQQLPAAVAGAASTSTPLQPLPRCCCIGVGATGRCWPPPSVSGGQPYTILWHSNQFGPRGTEIAMFDYAASFEEFLCGVSHVQTFGLESLVNRMPYPESLISLPKFQQRFPGRTHLLMRNGRSEVDEVLANTSAHAFYAIQYGTVAGTVVWPSPSQGGRVKTLLHAVFDGNEPHYDSFAVVGDTIPRAPGVPVVHHIAYVNPEALALPGLRSEWGVPPTARVFCRHGGPDTFDIGFVREALCEHARAHPTDYFVLLGTAGAACEAGLPNILHLPKNVDMAFKQRYLNSCNACVHARSDGETFGLGVAECSMTGLPVLTFCSPPAAAAFHIATLGKEALLYCSKEELLRALAGFDAQLHAGRREVYQALYAPFGPSATMLEFMENFGILQHYMAVANPQGMGWQGKCEPIIALPE